MLHLKDLRDAENGEVKRVNGEKAALSDRAEIFDRGSPRNSGQAAQTGEDRIRYTRERIAINSMFVNIFIGYHSNGAVRR